MSTKTGALKNLLLEKWERKELAHFYILSANELVTDKERIIENFLMDFMAKVMKLSTISMDAIRSHPDVFIWGNLENEVNYKEEDGELVELFRFNELAPQILKHKFIIIYHAHLVNNRIYNKLLKILEEPNKRTTIFLMNDRGIELLQTIHSRALQLKLPFEPDLNKSDKTEIFDGLEELIQNKITLNQLIEKVKTVEGKTDDQLARHILKWMTEKETKLDFQKLQKLTEILQNNSVSQAFNNARAERLFQLLAYAQKSL
jgi:DNA polymerase III delta prime subunit